MVVSVVVLVLVLVVCEEVAVVKLSFQVVCRWQIVSVVVSSQIIVGGGSFILWGMGSLPLRI